jgi:hypothetical protein
MVGTLGLTKCVVGCTCSWELKELTQEELGEVRGAQGDKWEKGV